MTNPVRAIFLMILAMAAFALGDALIKLAANSMPISQVLFFISIGSLVIFGTMALIGKQNLFSSRFWARGVVLRNAAEVFGTVCMVGALALAPLVQVVAITQVMPVLVTLGAVFVLGEKVGPRRWAAVLVGLAGVLIILRPGPSLEWGAILAFGAAAGLGMRDVFTRLVPNDVGVLQLVVWAMVVLVPVSILMLVFDGGAVQPQGQDWLLVAGALLATALAYFAITASVRLAEVSVVSPFRYTRLIFGTAMGVMIFGETLDGPTLAGSVLIIGAGLFIMIRERRAVPLSHDVEVR